LRNQNPVQRRATRDQPANPHYSGHSAGIHPENQPCLSGDLEEDDSYYETRPHTSARRYPPQVIQQGNRRLVIHREPPPRRFHRSFILGMGMLLALVLWVGGSYVLSWWSNHQLDSTYGNPRTYQTDQNVGHGTANDPNSHFIAENLHGEIMVIEIPGDDPSKSKIYLGPQLYGDNADLTPVTLTFKDVNGSGKLDMIIHVQDQNIVFLNDGTQFKAPKP
jgi:hypothetical protein